MTAVDESRDPKAKALLRRLYLELNRYRLEADRLRQPIAIVGLAGRFPGGEGIAEFWASLLAGRCLSQGLPPGRHLHRDGLPVDDADAVCRHGAFLAEVDRFDAEFFQIAPVEAQYLDPQHRMLLETSWHALEEAGINPDRLRGGRAGVYAGVCGNDYRELVAASDGARSIYIATGTSDSTAIGRVAFALGLEGPAIAVDTACSSSLVAIHQAVTALQQGEVDLALAGGVNVILSTCAMDASENGGMLAADGRCKTFDAAADGYVRGEGCAMIVLRRLADAEAAGDRIRAVIRGTAVNQDGASAGLTVPSGPAQERVIAAALARAGLEPAEVDYLEAHGTGTKLGDPIEIHAAAAAYGRGRADDRPLLVGSVKTNIGHLEAAAGVAGLVKATLAMSEGRIPPHVNFSAPNPAVDWPGSPVRVVTGTEDWPIDGERPPRAGVSSFGFSGTNAHLVLEGYRTPDAEPPSGRAAGVAGAAIEIPLPDGAVAAGKRRPERLLPLSGRSAAAVRALAERHLDRLREAEAGETDDDLADLAWTASVGRSRFGIRAGVVFRDGAGLAAGLTEVARGRRPAPRGAGAKAGFLFTGQGSQWAGMGRTLYETEPVARGVLDRCEAVMRETTGDSLLEVLLDPANESLDDTAWTQPALYALGGALTAEWRALGIRPAAVLGHSVGELAAAHAAGVFSLEEGLRFAIRRGRIMAAAPGRGAMAAVHGSRGRVEAAIREAGGHLSIAADNGTHVVVSGPAAAVERLRDALAAAGVRSEGLRTSHAFHSALMEPVLDELERIAPSGAAPALPLVGNVTGQELKEAPGPGYWRRQARHEVAFAAGVSRLAALGVEVLVEIGPRAVLGPLARAIWPGENEPPIVVASLRKPRADGAGAGFAAAAGAAWEAGLPLRLEGLFTGERRRRVALPAYPFERRRHWVETGRRPAARAHPEALDDLLYRVEWRGAPLRRQAPPTPAAAPAPGTWILRADRGGVARALAARLAARGEKVLLADRTRPDPEDCVPGVTAACLETDRREAWSALAREVPADLPLRGVVDLSGLDCHSAAAPPADIGNVLVDTGTAALALVQGLDDAGAAPTAGTWFATRGAQLAGGERTQGVAGAVLWGFARTVGLEMAHLEPRLVDLDPDAPVDPELLLDELLAGDGETEIVWRSGQRLAARLVRAGVARPPATEAPAGEGGWLITGGLGGLGLEVAAWLADRGAGKIVLNGRREPDAARQAAIDALTARGVEVRVEVADVADRATVDAMLARISPPLAGVIHCAGAVADAALDSQDRTGLEQALLAKAAGAWHLHCALADREPSAFVLFSSVAGVLGNSGQANYAAANAFLDQLAGWRRARGLAGQAIAWGPWAGAGMAERRRGELAGRLEVQGMGWLTLPRGLAILDRLLGAGEPAALAASIDWLTLVRRQPRLAPRLEDLLPAFAAETGTEHRPGSGGLVTRLRECAPGEREARLVRVLSDELQSVLMLPSAPSPSIGFFELGMDSLTATELRNRLNRVLAGSYVAPATIAFDYPDVASLARHLAGELGEALGEAPPAAPAPLVRERVGPIAIVGMACRFPGGDGLDGFRSLLDSGGNAIGRPPPDRAAGEHEGTGSWAGGFIEAIDRFDAEFFRIAPVEAKLLDPQQRLLLETSWHALEEAGIDPGALRGSRTGVYAGISMSDYRDLLVAGAGFAGFHSATGTSVSAAIGRIAYTLGLEGPAMAIDTACSSSLVAVHQAVAALQRGEADLALAGGVNALLSLVPIAEFVESGMLAPDGQCKTFDAAANGYGRGEGCGMVVLRRLDDAVAAGDRIRAVIRGSAVNQDGASAGLTVPNGPAQERVIAEALARAGLAPAGIDYLEAHGTGTELGDPIEIGAAAAVFGRERPADRPLLVGSVKTNIGHLEAAAGVAGLIKVALALAARRIPRHLNFSVPNPHIDWDRLPVRVVSEATDWPSDGDRPPRAALSSFGFSGTNAHVILEGAPPSDAPDAGDPDPPAVAGPPVAVALPEGAVPAGRPRGERLLPLSGRSAAAVGALAGRYLDWLREDPPGPPEEPLADMAWTAATGRSHLELRAGLTFRDRKGLVAGLGALARGARQATGGACARPAFLFTGQGSQWGGMGRDLYETEPVVRGVLDRCDAVMRELRGESLLDVMFAPADPALDDTYWTQPALYTLACALAAQWQSLGVRPVALLGHSVGELAAAQVAGMIPLAEGLRFAARRGALMASLPDRGAMAAVFAPRERVEAALATDGAEGVSVAADNGTHLVLAGPVPAVERVREAFAAAGVRTASLRTRQAFHSALMDPILDDLERAAPTLSPPAIPLLSNVTGRALKAAPDGAYWRRHARGEVAFAAGAAELAALEVDVLIEIGPQPVLGPLARANWPGGAPSPPVVASLGRPAGGDSPAGFAGAAAAAWETGLTLRLEGLFTGERRRRISVPTYPFQRRRYWLDGAGRRRRSAGHPLLGARTELVDGSTVYEVEVSADDPDWLADHRVFDRPVVPGALFAVLAAAAVAPPDGPVTVEGFQIHSPLILEEDGSPHTIQVMAGPPDAQGARNVAIGGRGRGRDGADWVRHAEARVLADAAPHPAGPDPATDPAGSEPAKVDVSELYRELALAGAEFGPAFRRIAEARRVPGAAAAEAVLSPEPALAGTFIHPALLDGVLQTVAAAGEFGEVLYMPIGWERLWFRGPMPERLTSRVRLRETASPGSAPDTLIADLVLAGDDGTPVGEVSGFTARRATRSQLPGAIDRTDGLLYETVWRNAPATGGIRPASFLRPPSAIAAGEAGPEPWLVAEGIDPAAPAILEEALERLAAGYARHALNALDWRPGRGQDAGALRAELKVVRSQEALLGRVLELAAAADDDPEPDADPAGLAASLAERHPFGAAEIGLLAHCGEPLAEVLRGRRDPVALLFEEAGAGAAALYRESPMLRASNRLLASAVASMVDALPAGRTLRVLEIGGGTGATTETVLDALPAGRFQYTFTDISAAFLDPARQRFEAQSLAFDVLDIERDPVAQGFAAHGFDLVIAANVLHATRDLGESLDHCRRLLAPGGGLVLLEGLAPQGWLDLTFGLLEGWWRHADAWRSAGPLIDGTGWRRVLAAAGFGEVEVLATSLDRAGRALQGVILAKGPSEVAEAPGTWVIAGPQAAPAFALARSLVEHNQTAIVAGPDAPDVPAESSPIRQAPLELERREAWRALLGDLPDEPSFAGVVLLAGTEPDGSDPASAADRVSAWALALVQGLDDAGKIPASGVWLVSAGGQVVEAEPAAGLAGSVLGGFVRTVTLEMPSLGARLVDLDPGEPDSIGRLVGELLGPDRETAVAWRGGTRHAARLVRLEDGPRIRIPGDDPWRLVADEGGSLEALRAESFSSPPLRDGEVRVGVLAAGINFHDVLAAMRLVDAGAPLGGDLCGRVIDVGPGVAFEPGDRVVGFATPAFASEAITRAELLAPAPPDLSAAELATMPTVFTTAALAFQRAGLRAGERVLVHAAAGGVGQAAVRLAREIGAEVLATASAGKQDLVRALGVAQVFDSRRPGFEEGVRRATAGAGVDVVLNCLTGEGFIESSLASLAPGGRFVEISKRGIRSTAEMAEARPDVAYQVLALDEELRARPAAVGKVFRALMERCGAGGVAPLPFRAWPISEAGAAMSLMRRGEHVGKLVLTTPAAGRLAGTWLITGGLGGLGLAVAGWLAERGVEAIVLNGRSEPDEAQAAAISGLRSRGIKVRVERADVADGAAVEAMLERTVATLPPLTGVVHAAGTLSDGALSNLSHERFRRVTAAKVHGAWNLHRATMGMKLESFVLFSSLAGVTGNAGQANHAAANAFLDQLARHRRALGLPGQAIAWGAWLGIGKAEEERERIGERIGAGGVGWMPPQQGLACFDRLLREEPAAGVAAPVDWRRFVRGRRDDPLLDEVLPAHPVSAVRAAETDDLPTRLAAAPPARREPLAIEFLQREIGAALQLDSPPSPDAVFADLGMDSLMAVEIRGRLNRALAGAYTAPGAIAFNYPTIRSLAGHLLAELGHPAPERTAARPPADPDEAHVEGLSAEELFAEVAAELGEPR